MIGVVPRAGDTARSREFFLGCLALARGVVDCRSLGLSVALGGRNGLVGGLGGFIIDVGITVVLVRFTFGRCPLSLLGSDRLKALSLSVRFAILSLGIRIIGTLLLWRSTLLGRRSDRLRRFSVGVGFNFDCSSRFLGGRALLGWLSRVIVGRGGSTALLGCLGGRLGVVHVGVLSGLG